MTKWTSDKIAVARQEWRDGRSAADIADMLGTTRSAVLGKLFRLGELDGKRSSNNVKRRVVKRRGQVAVRVFKTMRQDGKQTAINDLPIPAERPAPVKTVPLAKLEDSHCRFPFGTGPYQFCGGEALPGQPYCAEHHRVCHRSPEDRRPTQAAEREKVNERIARARRVLMEGVE